MAEASARPGAAGARGGGGLPAGLAGAIARPAAMVLQMDPPPQATRLDEPTTWPSSSPPATDRHWRASAGDLGPSVLPALARRRVLLGSAAVAVVAVGGGGAQPIARPHGKEPGTRRGPRRPTRRA